MEVRLDERTTSAEETRALGIEIGDFVALDPRVEITNGFIRSRHLDDKSRCYLRRILRSARGRAASRPDDHGADHHL